MEKSLDLAGLHIFTFDYYGLFFNLSIYIHRPERFLLGDLVDWMFEVMDKTPEDWNYRRNDLRHDIKPLILHALLQYLPIGLNSMRSPTLDKLERVSKPLVQKNSAGH